MFSAEDRRLLRDWTIAARNTMHPHGDGCWHVHWPCRVLALLDDTDALHATVDGERVAHARELEELKALNAILNRDLDQARYLFDQARALVAEHHDAVKEMTDRMGTLHA
jgi:hypothetical protein